MEEIFDRLVIRLLLAIFVCVVFVVYRFAHVLFYPSIKNHVFKNIDVHENSAETLHFFSRIVGLSIVVSSLNFHEGHGFLISVVHFLIWGIITAILYLGSLYMIESIVLYNFDYKDEVIKKQNMAFAIISATHSIAISYLVRQVITQADNSFIILSILWLLALIIMGLSSKYFNFISKLSLSKLVVQKNLAVSFSYLGFFMGATYLASESFNQEHYNINTYLIQVVLKILLALIIYPIFKLGLSSIFRLKKVASDKNEFKNNDFSPKTGIGFFEGSLFLASAILTSMIVNHIKFSTIYPFF
jgi:uncharacterized membrane protein YjfL (UPF0719 family)